MSTKPLFGGFGKRGLDEKDVFINYCYRADYAWGLWIGKWKPD